MKNRLLLSRSNIFLVLVVTSLFLSACGPGSGIASGADGTIVWLDQPMTNYMLPLAPFTLIAHAGLPGGGISQMDFLVNGVSVGAVSTDTNSEFLRAELSWNPSGPGEYHIEVRATSPGGTISSHLAYVCVTSGLTSPVRWVGNCDATPSSLFSLSVNLRTDPVYRGACPGNALDLEAQLSGNTSSIAVLQAGWYFTNLDGSAPPSVVAGESGQEMVRQSDTSYTSMRDFTNAGRDFGLGADAYLLHASVRALDASGNVLATQDIGPVDWLDCPATATPTFTPVPADTISPSITGIVLNPADIVYYISGCGPNSISVQGDVNDPSGIGQVTLAYQYSAGPGKSIGMTSGGGSTYSATISVGTEAYGILSGVDGTLTISIEATDRWGNATSINIGTVAVKFCPG
jgi:hypothetical protein